MSTSPAAAPATELIARAVIVDNEHVLLARQHDKKWFFLPGGHVEPGEGTENALLREINEELGTTARITGFAGAVEHAYTEDNINHRELNLVFTIELADTETATSHEDHLEFVLVPFAELASTDLRPSALKDALLVWTSDRTPFWRGCPVSAAEPANTPRAADGSRTAARPRSSTERGPNVASQRE